MGKKKKSFHQSSNSPMFTYATQSSLKDKKPHWVYDGLWRTIRLETWILFPNATFPLKAVLLLSSLSDYKKTTTTTTKMTEECRKKKKICCNSAITCVLLVWCLNFCHKTCSHAKCDIFIYSDIDVGYQN